MAEDLLINTLVVILAAVGDASRSRVLEAVGLARAALLVITFGECRVVERLLHNARQQGVSVPSIVSADDHKACAALAAAGAVTVFPEKLAAGLALADQVLLYCGYSRDDVAGVVTAIRAQLNPELTGHVGI
jgi:CPA2 family monovalent cation:H+ antiporter-2